MTIPGSFEYFSENRSSQKTKAFSENQSFLNQRTMITPFLVLFEEGRYVGHIMG